MAPGTKAPEFDLPGVDGNQYSLDSFSAARVLVIVFTCNHCPYAVAVEDRLIAVQNDYRDQGVQLVAISANDADAYPADSFEEMKKRSNAKEFPYPYLYDESQETARAYVAACTPDVYIFNQDRELYYHGRIDDSWKDPEAVKRADLRAALDQVLAGTTLDFAPQPSMGCNIKWKPQEL
jgi:peroxiredoxin